MPDLALVEPALQAVDEELVGEILAPERGVLHAGLGERAVEVEHADQPRPGARPVGHGQDRALVRDQPGQHVMGVLPDGLGHDQLALGIDAGKDAHAFFLRADEAVLLVFLVRMGADQFVAGLGHGLAPAASSISFCLGQQFWLAESRRSPLAASNTCF